MIQDYSIHSVNKQNTQTPLKQVSKLKIDHQFESFLNQALKNETKTGELTISNHAQKRLEQRGLTLEASDLSKISEAMETLETKGAQNSLILYDEMALIASIKNRTIITALKTDEMNEVTNIDSAVKI
ncbi:TIGR02530 family flagellar biosynthesis protein [Lacticigenium naphthae]|uniref:TIGR02530 family flagellar biosynthesis protein n=1 Tax=Lacticigenium naphthae TaxID=515351 RepID=UPI000415F478|nr:TIGR02530 family flagellar biosynthesis protein [Lacticigenium naphthae]